MSKARGSIKEKPIEGASRQGEECGGKWFTGRKMQASPFLPEEEPDGPPPLHFRASMEPAGGELGPIPTLPSINWEKTSVTVSGPVTPQPHE